MKKHVKLFEDFKEEKSGPSYGGVKSGKPEDQGGRGTEINGITFYWVEGTLLLVNDEKTQKIEVKDIPVKEAEELLADIYDSDFKYDDLSKYLESNKYDFEIIDM